MKRCTVIITHYVPSGFSHRPDRVETELLDLHYSGLYPNPSDIKATDSNSGVYEKLGNLDARELSLMIMNGTKCHMVKSGYEGRTYTTTYSIVN